MDDNRNDGASLHEASKDAFHAEFNIEEALQKARALVHHQWKQRGPHLECAGCQTPHGYYIGMDKRLVGVTERGEPMLDRRP